MDMGNRILSTSHINGEPILIWVNQLQKVSYVYIIYFYVKVYNTEYFKQPQ